MTEIIRNFLSVFRKDKMFIFVSPTLFVVVWEIVSSFELINPLFLPSPLTISKEFFFMITSGELVGHAAISLSRTAAGFGFATVLAIPLGIIIGWSKTTERIVEPLLMLFRPVPTPALVPLAILWLGIGFVSQVFVVAWACFWVIFLNTIAGVKATPIQLVKAVRSLGGGEKDVIREVIIPSASPSIFAGLRVSIGVAFILLVVAEMVGANSGLGYLILFAERIFETEKMFVGIITITLLGFFSERIIRMIEKKFISWHYEMSIARTE